MVLLAALSVLGAFDLAFTQTQMMRGNFAEANVLAATVAPGQTEMAAYKTVLFGLGALILYRCRRHRASELAVWLLVVCHAGLMVWWLVYLDIVENCLDDPVVTGALVPF